MKKIILVVLTLIITATVANAASINGEFEGSPIIKMKSNGIVMEVKDVPAILYNGRTMVPVYMLSQLGLEVTWDQKTYSVNAVIPKTESSSLELNRIKALVWSLDYYGALRGLSDSFYPLQLSLQLNLSYIQDGNMQNVLTDIDLLINNAVTSYNKLQVQAETFIKSLHSNGINDININNSLNSYFKAIDYYKLAADDLKKYSTGNVDSFDDFFAHIKDAINENSIGWDATNAGYNSLYQIIQNQQSLPTTPTPTTTPAPTIVDTTPVILPVTTSVIKSKIESDFDGFDYGNIYELTNGQYWKQVDYTYEYEYEYRPDVMIYKEGSFYYMDVENCDKHPRVELIN